MKHYLLRLLYKRMWQRTQTIMLRVYDCKQTSTKQRSYHHFLMKIMHLKLILKQRINISTVHLAPGGTAQFLVKQTCNNTKQKRLKLHIS